MYRMTYAFVTPFCNPHLPEENSPRQHLRKGRIVAQCDTFSLKTRDNGELYLASDPWLLHIYAEELKTGELAVDIMAIPLEVVPPGTADAAALSAGGNDLRPLVAAIGRNPTQAGECAP